MSVLFLHEVPKEQQTEVSDILDFLPELPEPDFDDKESAYPEPRDIILYRFDQTNIVLVEGVTRETASEYASRDDTEPEADESGHRPWFVGFDYS